MMISSSRMMILRRMVTVLMTITVFCLGTSLSFTPPNSNIGKTHHFHQKRERFDNEEKTTESMKMTNDNIIPEWIRKGLTTFGIAGTIMIGSMILPTPNNNVAHAESIMAAGKRYWSVMEGPSVMERVVVNEALLDYAVGTINTQYYDNTGGVRFNSKEFYQQWKTMKKVVTHEISSTSEGSVSAVSNSNSNSNNNNNNNNNKMMKIPSDITLDTREGAVHGLKWLVNSLDDPFSKYLTREELKKELEGDSCGFLGTGAVVEPPNLAAATSSKYGLGSSILMDPPSRGGSSSNNNLLFQKSIDLIQPQKQQRQQHSNKKFLTNTRVANLPVITAVGPDSPAERAGLVVGDRIVAVGEEEFVGWTKEQVAKALQTKYNAESYLGHAQLTVAKPVFYIGNENNNDYDDEKTVSSNVGGGESQLMSQQQQRRPQEIVIGYRQARVLVPIKPSFETTPMIHSSQQSSFSDDGTASTEGTKKVVAGGDNIVHYELLSSSMGSIFDHSHSDDVPNDEYNVGYIRLTRFSKKSTEGYLQALQALEDAGAQSYILDLRNNYGGVIQEAMLTASTLLRDPHAILCYTMNARGGFTPHDVEEYVVDKRYPGYLLSKESTTATLDQVRKETPAMFEENGIAWDPPSSFASLHEQITKRGIRRISYNSNLREDPTFRRQSAAQKKVVVLINEGTASSAEVFTAALHDNGRTAALVGSKTYGKGLIQHTFPMPDGGGLRITVAEYLTPALRHVTNVGGARFDRLTGSFVGGGIRPDISCESNGIPGNIKADLCVGVALDALEEATAEEEVEESSSLVGPFAVNFPSSIIGSRHR